jgi:capsular polysaccharide transport system permease protein
MTKNPQTETMDQEKRALAPPLTRGDLTNRSAGTIDTVLERPPLLRLRIDRRVAAAILAVRPPSYLATFIVCVLIPSLIVIVYLWAFASDQYLAEARFAIRSTTPETIRDGDRGSNNSAGQALSSGTLPTLAGQDAYVVAAYIRSSAILSDLPPTLDPRVLFDRPEADAWFRLAHDASIEETTAYWREMVTTYVDGPSGMVTVNVRAFRPADAKNLAEAILTASEKLVNSLTARARRDAMAHSEEDVRNAEKMVRDSLAEMRIYRDTVGYIDPAAAAASTSQLLLEAMSEKIRLENEYFVAARAMAANAPTVTAMKTRLEAYDRQIEQLRGRLTGESSDGRAISAGLAHFEELELKRVFAEKMYAMSQNALERARQRAERQSLYLTVFVPPMLPEEATYPKRTSFSLLIPAGLLVLWGIMALIAATVEDHTF